jgi:hypothetical protein
MSALRYLPPALALSVAFGLPIQNLQAEPYLAVESGLKCMSCHTNPSGGGKRNLFGMTYARTNLTERTLLADDDTQGWNSQVTEWLGIGGDFRGGYLKTQIDGLPDRADWMTTKATGYLEIRPIQGLLTLYADEQVSPGGSLNRETYLLLTPAQGKYTIKAGQMFLPFGHRLQDDSAFVRQRSGINFNTPDDGVEFGRSGRPRRRSATERREPAARRGKTRRVSRPLTSCRGGGSARA